MTNALINEYTDPVVTYDELGDCHTPTGTQTYYPIDHRTVAGLVRDKLQALGIPIKQEEYILSQPKVDTPHQFDRMFGLITLDTSAFNLDGHDWQPTIGVRNSHDKAFSVGVCGGSETMVCSNLCFWSEFTLQRRHSVNMHAELLPLIYPLIDKVVELPRLIDHQQQWWKKQTVTDYEAEHLVIEATKRGAITPGKILEVIDEYHTPTYDYPGTTPDSLYSLKEAFTVRALRPQSNSALNRAIKPMQALNTVIGNASADQVIQLS